MAEGIFQEILKGILLEPLLLASAERIHLLFSYDLGRLFPRLELFFDCLESVFYQGEFVEYFFEDSSEFFFSWSDVLSRSQRCGQRPYGSGSQGVWEI